MDWNAPVALLDITAQLLTVDEIRPDDVVRGEDAGAVGSKYVLVRSVGCELKRSRLVVRGGSPFCKCSIVPALNVRMRL